MPFWKKREYMDWDEYHSFVATVDDFFWRQGVRERNLARL